MSKKKGGGGGGHGGAPWVITFADLMSLLMALFVMIVSFSSQDEQKLHDAAGSMRDAFGYQSVQRPAGMIEQNGIPERKYPRDTEATTLATSIGRMVRRSITSASMPRAASSATALTT